MNTSTPDIPERTDRQDRPANPGDAYPPTRPGPILIALALGLIVVGLGIENWPDVSALARSAGL
jgi:hypothetical protein